VVGVLCVFGLIMVGSASPVISLGLYGSPWVSVPVLCCWPPA
jgi:hypothetical protein